MLEVNEKRFSKHTLQRISFQFSSSKVKYDPNILSQFSLTLILSENILIYVYFQDNYLVKHTSKRILPNASCFKQMPISLSMTTLYLMPCITH